MVRAAAGEQEQADEEAAEEHDAAYFFHLAVVLHGEVEDETDQRDQRSEVDDHRSILLRSQR